MLREVTEGSRSQLSSVISPLPPAARSTCLAQYGSGRHPLHSSRRLLVLSQPPSPSASNPYSKHFLGFQHTSTPISDVKKWKVDE
ncbi:hypothetical protein NPIL_652621 [Nephila pilipes]|uniref:Uncharacterized protein n=1 Tax=Nephila pilipes TaxID=299642 RepID=A0A8X6MVV3_NEPPI|nr:hypothetical protein NPIL_652621 [Nephila pilipes]